MSFLSKLFSSESAPAPTEDKSLVQDLKGQVDAINKVMAVIEFNLDGTIITANQNFLSALGYTLDEIKGQHHRLFVDPKERESSDYRRFWEKLGRGEFDAAQYKRIAKGGREIWIQASYNPIMDAAGRPFKVVKYATDITEQKQKTADFEGQLAAIGKAMAVIEFSLDGQILNANENFLKTLGYTLGEVKGQHHRLFVTPAYQNSPEYQAFWAKLGRGEYDAGQYLRVGKGGREIWIQASYNPIMDMNGRPFKVVKYATDITEQVKNNQAMKQAVEETQSVVGAAIEGDLTQRIPMDDKSGALEALCSSVNALVDNMFSVISMIKTSSNSVAVAAGQIAAGNTDLSQRTEEQASSLEETASSMEQLTSTVKQNADNAKQANTLASSASNVAAKGGTVVGQVVKTMGEINDSSRRIVDIISVIDGIAFQTNILALNAAVEAARAGEQGRGFAVVASEVRNLAQRSASAAKEIKTLIGDSVGKVDAGSRLVSEAGQTMEEIVSSISQVTRIITEISSASTEQSAGIEQINRAVVQMEEVVQQNAALVEQASAASESLRQQAVNMSKTVGRFNLGDHEATPAAAPMARAPMSSPSRRPAARPAPSRAPARPLPKAAKVAPLHAGSDDEWAEF